MAHPLTTKRTVFIGHGRSDQWQGLVSLLQQRGFSHEEFNTRSVAGLYAADRLEEMLARSSFALLVMTAEDAMADGATGPRSNVVHEAGFAQGRLGLDRAVILVEEGCTLFSNISGVMTIHFPRNDIKAAFQELRMLLERWERTVLTPAEPHDKADSNVRPEPLEDYGAINLVVIAVLAVGVTLWFVHGHFEVVFRGLSIVLVFLGVFARRLLGWHLRRRRKQQCLRDYEAGSRVMTDRQLYRTVFTGESLRGSDLSRCNFHGAELRRCNLDDCRLLEADLREVLFENVSAVRADFSRANLSGAYLRKAILSRAKFRCATLMDARAAMAELDGVDLAHASLVHANLFHANLRGANLQEADLRGAVLADSDLRDANLSHADIRDADFSGANLQGAILVGLDRRHLNDGRS